MKNLIVLIVVAFIAFSQLYAQSSGFNPTVTNTPVVASTSVFTPLSIKPDPNNLGNHLGNLIQGQTRLYAPKIIYLFNMTRQNPSEFPNTVRFDIYPPVDNKTGVTLDCYWGFKPVGNPNENFQNYNAGTGGYAQWIQWTWDPTDFANMDAKLYVNSATAAIDAALGTHTFSVTINGWYDGI
jgi:hypothetical protein